MAKKIKKNRVALNQMKKKLGNLKKYLPIFEKQRAALNKMLNVEEGVLDQLEEQKQKFLKQIEPWVAVFADSDVDITELIRVSKVVLSSENVFGTTIPIYEKVEFKVEKIDFGAYPLWVFEGIDAVKEKVELEARLEISKKRMKLIKKGYEESNQKVNLFDKKLIPEVQAGIKEIKTALDTQAIASIVIAKSAKKLQERKSAA